MEALSDGLFRAQIDGRVAQGARVTSETVDYEVVEIESDDPPFFPTPRSVFWGDSRRITAKVRVTRGTADIPMLVRDETDGGIGPNPKWVDEQKELQRIRDAPPCPHCGGTGKLL